MSGGGRELQDALAEVVERLGVEGAANPARVRAALADRLGSSLAPHRDLVDAVAAAAVHCAPGRTDPDDADAVAALTAEGVVEHVAREAVEVWQAVRARTAPPASTDPLPTLPEPDPPVVTPPASTAPAPTPPPPTPPPPTPPPPTPPPPSVSPGEDPPRWQPPGAAGGDPLGLADATVVVGADATESGRRRRWWLVAVAVVVVVAGIAVALLVTSGGNGTEVSDGGGSTDVTGDGDAAGADAGGGATTPTARGPAHGAGLETRFWGFAQPFATLFEVFCVEEVSTEVAPMALPVAVGDSLGCVIGEDEDVADLFAVDAKPDLVQMATTWGSPDASVIEAGRWSRDGTDAGDYLVTGDEAGRLCGYMSYDDLRLLLRNCRIAGIGWYPRLGFAPTVEGDLPNDISTSPPTRTFIDHDRLEELQRVAVAFPGTRCEDMKIDPGDAWVLFVAGVYCDLPDYRTNDRYYPGISFYGAAVPLDATRVNYHRSASSDDVEGTGEWSTPDGGKGAYRDIEPTADGVVCRFSYRYGDVRWIRVCAGNRRDVQNVWVMVR